MKYVEVTCSGCKRLIAWALKKAERDPLLCTGCVARADVEEFDELESVEDWLEGRSP